MAKIISFCIFLAVFGSSILSQNVDGAGSSSISAAGSIAIINETGNLIPERFDVFQACPNSFGPNSTIKFTVPFTAGVSLNLYDKKGYFVCNLLNDRIKAGTYTIDWLPKDKEGGIYTCELISGEFRITKNIVLAK